MTRSERLEKQVDRLTTWLKTIGYDVDMCVEDIQDVNTDSDTYVLTQRLDEIVRYAGYCKNVIWEIEDLMGEED